MDDERHPKTLYVGNLDSSVTEDFLCALFGNLGAVKGCKIIRDTEETYAFIEFLEHGAAATALAAMNKRVFLEREMKVNWATRPGNQPKMDTANHHHVFVGDLSPEIDTNALQDAFAPFGEISNCRIVRDSATLKPRGYAFVSFVRKTDAEAAIQAMNGQWLGSRPIKTNWSTRGTIERQPNQQTSGSAPKRMKQSSFDEIFKQSSPTNRTVYCGGFPNNFLTTEIVQMTFSKFGTIENERVFKDKGYAFIKFTKKEDATRAIESTHNTEVMGYIVKCFWGKEHENAGNQNQAQQPQQYQQQENIIYQYPYNPQQMNYWYPQGYPQGFPTVSPSYNYQQYAAAYNQSMASGSRMVVPHFMAGATWTEQQPGAQMQDQRRPPNQ